MKLNRIILIVIVLILLFFIIFGLNFYFLQRLNEQITQKNNKSSKFQIISSKSAKRAEDDIEIVLRLRVKDLKPVYKNRNPRFYAIRRSIWENFIPRPYDNLDDVWAVSNQVRKQ